MKILLLGKNGQVGWELQRSLAPLGEVIAPGRQEGGDLACLDSLRETILRVKPSVIVNAAAYTAVDKAEIEKELAFLVNAKAPEVLAEEADNIHALLVHYSTDYVFDGSSDHPRRETETPAPLNVYGESKLAGETAVRRAARHLVFRTSWVYAARGNNFAKTMLRLSKEKDELKVINDQFGAPTGAELIADVTSHAVRHVVNHPQDGGLYHLCAAGETCWYDYAKLVIAEAEKRGFPVRVQAENIHPIPTSAYPTPARRPLNSRLDGSLLESVFGLKMPAWQSGVIRMQNELLASS